MQTDRIFIIRHGEKPGHPVPAPGIPDDNSLTAAGWERARGLVAVFHPAPGQTIRAGLAVPEHLFAANIADPESSKRPVQTITPLAQSFRPEMPINSEIATTETDRLARVVRAAGGTVLVAWEHKNIIPIATALAPQAAIPAKWPGDRFDIIFVFDRNDDGSYAFSQLPELMLPTDQSTVLV